MARTNTMGADRNGENEVTEEPGTDFLNVHCSLFNAQCSMLKLARSLTLCDGAGSLVNVSS